MAPKFKSMLPSSPTGPTECLQIMALDFRSPMFGALGDNRHYDAWLAECDMVPAYRYHERVLKLLQWKFPTRPWHLKSPAHMDSIDALLAVYPDARFVMTHRDIAQVIPSLVSLFDATSELPPHRSARRRLRRATRPPTGSAHCARRSRTATPATTTGSSTSASPRCVPTPSPPSPGSTSGSASISPTRSPTRMRTWWETNPADKQGVHDYHPEHYGIDLDDLRTQFAFYNDRFVDHVTARLARQEIDNMDLGLKDATVIVAGGTTGMGRAAADCFAADGARVAVLARSRDQLDETTAALTDLGSPDAIGLQVDLFDGGSVEAGDRPRSASDGAPSTRSSTRPDPSPAT